MSTTSRVGDYMQAIALQGVRQRAAIHYTQQWPARWRGITNHHTGMNQPDWADCSAYATWVAWAARRHIRGSEGADVMNGLNWRAGYTGTLIEHGSRHRLGPRAWHHGRTLVFYGSPVEHVAIYAGNYPNGPMVVSFGSETGPLFLGAYYRSDFNHARTYAV